MSPLDIEIDGNRRILLISGPNAGGKSVCLKTAGLLQYMLQCGLLIPVHERSRAGLFKNLFIDIGDQQSIEDDLSTYSSHLLNMKHTLRNCDKHSLILIDEFGGGTEPLIGAAIAEALLKRFNERGAFGIITTHYQNLKHFADATPGIVNGAMLYDRGEMRPLFQLQIGNPGSSFAVEIARKIGLPEEVIADASQIVGSDYIQSDKYLQDIVRDKRYWESKRKNVHQKEKELDEMLGKVQLSTDELKSSRKQILKDAREEAERLLREANAKIENTIRTIVEAKAEKERTRKARQELSDFSKQLEELAAEKQQLKADREMAKILARQERKKNGKKEKNTSVQQGGNSAPKVSAPKPEQPKNFTTPDWAKDIPHTVESSFRKYGWILGVIVAIIGVGIMILYGFLLIFSVATTSTGFINPFLIIDIIGFLIGIAVFATGIYLVRYLKKTVK
jgi:DNA mismatch repair protein MutS2